MSQPQREISFDKIKLSGWTLYVNAAFPSRDVESLIAQPDFNGVRGPFEEVVASRFARVHKGTVSFKGIAHNLYVKQFLYRSTVDFLKHIFRPSRAMRSMNASQVLAKANLLSPEVIAMGHKKIGPFVAKSFLITASVEDAPTLSSQISKAFTIKSKRKFTRQLGETIGTMHAVNISHGDLRTGNILVKPNEDDWDFFFLDNERTLQFKTLPDKLRFKNLVQVNMLTDKNLTNTDRMRFYKSYLKKNEGKIQNTKQLAKKVIVRTAERLKNKQLSM